MDEFGKTRGAVFQVNTANSVRIIVADDNPGFIQTLVNYLDSKWELVATVNNGRALVEAADRLRPDVLIVDLHMPVVDGLEATRILKRSGNPAKIVIITSDPDPDFASAALAAGAVGYVIKDRVYTCLSRAIEKVLQGQTYVCGALYTTDK